jgi:hypothetical protein
MKKASRIVVATGLVVTLGLVATSLVADTVGTGDQDEAISMSGDECCFTNQRFTGTCRVVPGEGETCGSILAYLNNPNSVGKSYCGNTKIRGGWQQVSCNEGALVDLAPECRQ